MQNLIELFLKSVEAHDPNMLPLASRYRATENGNPAALCHMQTYRVIDRINLIGTTAIDRNRSTVYLLLSVAEGNHDVILGARLTAPEGLLTEVELNIYRSRSDTGFWFAVEEMEELEPMWDMVVPEEKRASRAELEHLAYVTFDNTMDASMFQRDEGCVLMESGGTVRENTGYGRLINPHIADCFPKEDMRVPIPFGVAPHRPNGNDTRVMAIDEEKGLIVAVSYMDGFVSPYLVSDETSTCFVPLTMIDNHRLSLLPEYFEGKSAFIEMRASAENVTIIKYFDQKMYRITQNINLKPYGCRSPWRKEALEV